MRYLSVFFTVCVAALIGFDSTHVLAQEQETLTSSYSGGPWNPHVPMTGAAFALPQPPSPLMPTAFANIAVSTSPNFQTECSISVNPKDSLNMIVEEIDGDFYGANGIFYTLDGGLTWKPSPLAVEAGDEGFGDPWTAFDANGDAFAMGLQRSPQGKLRTLLERSSDEGRTWSIIDHPFDGGAGDTTADEPVLAVDINSGSAHNGTIYSLSASDAPIPLLGSAPVGIMSYSLAPGSQPHSGWVKASPAGLTQIPHLTIAPTGKLYASYLMITDIGNLKGALWLITSTDAGLSWSQPTLIRGSQYTDTVRGFPRGGFPLASRIGPTPRIAIDTSNGPRRGWLYVSYAMPASADHKSDLDIFCQHSADDGKTWSDPVRVNDDPIKSLSDQLTPAMCINPDGALGIVFYDRRDDPNNYLLQTYIAISTDGGSTWQNERVSSAATDPIAAKRIITMAVADYISIAASRSAFFPIWTDGRNNNGDLNIYFAQVPIATSGVSQAAQPKISVAAYPNPVHGRSTVRFISEQGAPWTLRVIDLLGRDIIAPQRGIGTGLATTRAVDLSHTPAGAYLLRIETAGVSSSSHLVRLP